MRPRAWKGVKGQDRSGSRRSREGSIPGNRVWSGAGLGSIPKAPGCWVKAGRFPDLVGKGNPKLPPVSQARPPKKPELYLEAVLVRWEALADLVATYSGLYACAYYTPSLPILERTRNFGVPENAKRREGKIFIEDINKELAEYLSDERVPDLYLRLGEVIYHYLIDEFQDTSPIQWENLRPLLDNSLSQGGSLFVVGDAKQAIYGFRDADYRIMKGVETFNNPFPSALHCASRSPH